MTRTSNVRDIGDFVDQLAARIRRLEQQQTSAAATAFPANPVFQSVTVDTTYVDTTSNPATGLGLTTGIFQSTVFIDVAWTGASTANEYQVEVARKVSSTYQAPQQYRTAGTNMRVEGLLPNTTYGVRVYAINRLGLSSVATPSSGYTDITTASDTSIPSALSGLTVTAGFRTIMATWADTTDFDFDVYQLQLATNSGFSTGLRDVYVRGSIGGFTDLSPSTQYWMRVRTYDQSGNVGPWTAGASATTGQLIAGDVPATFITNAMIANLAVDTAKIADLSVLTAKIGNLAVTNAKFNDAVIDKISAGTIASKDYILGAGGQLKTSSITPGFIINSQGISFYNSGGTRTIFLDAATGSGTFYGTISAGTAISSPAISGGTVSGTTITGGVFRTASSGRRVEISSSVVDHIYFYGGDASETSPAYIAYSGLFGALDIHAGTTTAFPTSTSILLAPGGGISFSGLEFTFTGTTIKTTFQGPTEMAGDIKVYGDLYGTAHGTQAPRLKGRGGHIHTFDWTDPSGPYKFYVDNVDVSATVKTFVIDHPTDRDRYLVHATVEGPTADVFYRGRGRVTEFWGSETVRLPDYFKALAHEDSATVIVVSNNGVPLEWSAVSNGEFTVTVRKPTDFTYVVFAERRAAKFTVDPLKDAVVAKGSGPYTYLSK